MAFKTYQQLSLPIVIQQVNEYSATETKTVEAITEKWSVFTSINSKSVILVWYQKVEETLDPLKSMDCIKTLTKKAVNDKYIEVFQIEWSTSNTMIWFRLGHNLYIDALLEDLNLGYILDNHEANLKRDKIQSIDTEIIVWPGWSIL